MLRVLVIAFLVASLAVSPSKSWDSRCKHISTYKVMQSFYRLTKDDMQRSMAGASCAACYRQICTLEQLKEAYKYHKLKGIGMPGEPSWYNTKPGVWDHGDMGVAWLGPCIHDVDDCAYEMDGERAIRLSSSDSISVAYVLCCRNEFDDRDNM